MPIIRKGDGVMFYGAEIRLSPEHIYTFNFRHKTHHNITTAYKANSAACTSIEDKIELMRAIFVRKCVQLPNVYQALYNTNGMTLYYYNEADLLWGVDQNCEGQNLYGEILLKIRAEGVKKELSTLFWGSMRADFLVTNRTVMRLEAEKKRKRSIAFGDAMGLIEN